MKCQSLSYIYEQGHRHYEDEPFLICGQKIPVTTLKEGIEYLGINAATSHRIRRKGVDNIIKETRNLIAKIGDSMLSLNQKIYAIKVFAIPQLDYILSNGKVRLGDLDDIDRLIRRVIDDHLGGTKIPIDLFYTHWKDGGLSFQPPENPIFLLPVLPSS